VGAITEEIPLTVIRLADVDELTPYTAPHHHPNLRAVAKDDYNKVAFTFAPFTGAEEEPNAPAGLLADESLPPAVRDLIEEEYREARRLWNIARYIRDLKAATGGASAMWEAYASATARMITLFAAMDSTSDSHWRGALSRLVAAQEAALEAAARWDDQARRIALVHDQFIHTGLTPTQAYEAVGVDARRWNIGSFKDYAVSYGRCLSAVPTIREAVIRQREHLRRVAELAGDRSASTS
jgi:hypothetical protein